MSDNLNKSTVNYTDEDRVLIIRNRILKWWLNKYHKKTVKSIEKLAKDYVRSSKKSKK